jgi:hypothetical protein
MQQQAGKKFVTVLPAKEQNQNIGDYFPSAI